MTCKLLRSFSVFVSVTLKHFTRSDGINHSWSIRYEICVLVYVLDLAVWHAKRIFSTQHYIAMRVLTRCTKFFSRYLIKVTIVENIYWT